MLDSTTIGPPVSDSVRNLVETGVSDHITGPGGADLRDSISDFIGSNLTELLDTLLSTIEVRTLPPSFDVTGIDGATVPFTFDSRYDDVSSATTGLTFALGVDYGTTRMSGLPESLGIPLSSGASTPTRPSSGSATSCRTRW